MKLNELENIIEAQMKSFYKKIVHISCDEYCKMNDSESRWKSNSLCGQPIDDKFSYSDGVICLSINKKWSKTEIYNFLNQAIGVSEIIDAINSKQIKLHICNVLDAKSGLLWEYTEEDLKRFVKDNEILLIVLTTLSSIGITVFGDFNKNINNT